MEDPRSFIDASDSGLSIGDDTLKTEVSIFDLLFSILVPSVQGEA